MGRAEAAALEARQVAVATREDCNTYVQNARRLAGDAQAAYERLAQQPPPPSPGPTPSGLDDFQQTAQRWLKECEASASVARQHAENASEFAKRANVSAGQAAKRAESIKDAAHRAIGESPGGAGPPQPFVTELKFELGQLQSQFRDLNQEIGQKVNEFVDLVSDVKIDTCNRLDDLDGKLARHSATGSSPKGGPSMDGLEADMQQFREELNDVWGRMEADAEAYDYLDERLTRLENKTTPSLGELGPRDNSRPPRLDRPGPGQQPARERNGPWYEDRRSERSERSETRGRAWYDRPADRHRRSSRDSLRSVRYGSYNRTERRYDPLEGLPEPPGWWKSGPYGPLPGVFGVHGDIRWFQIAPYFQDGYFIPGKAYRTAAQLKKDTIQKRAKIQPTGIPVEMAFKEAKPPLKFKSFTDIPRNATAASDEGMFGEHKNSWLDPRTKKALQKTAEVPVWDGEPATLERWIHRTLRWRRNYANRFDQDQQAKILIAAIENEGVRDRIEKAYDREDMSLKDLWFCITGRVMENINIHRPEAVWHARHLPKVVLTSSILADWMSDWMEEGADIPDGVTMRHATAQLLAVLKQHTKDVPADKEVKAAYNKLYSLQAEYAGVEFNYLEIFLMMLPLIQAREYQEQQEEYMNNPTGSEARKVRAFGSKGGGTGDRSRSKSRDGNRHGGESKRSHSQSGAHRDFRNRRDSVTSNTSHASSYSQRRKEEIQKSKQRWNNCANCGQPGQWARHCPHPKDDKKTIPQKGPRSQSKSRSRAKSDDICNRCGQKGHWASECPNKGGSQERSRGSRDRKGSKDRDHDTRNRRRSQDRGQGSKDRGRGSQDKRSNSQEQRRQGSNSKDRSRSRSSAKPDDICRRCGGKGHHAKDCPTKL